MSLSGILQLRVGLQNFFQPYAATILPIRASLEQQSVVKHGGGKWNVLQDFEIVVSAKRLARDNVDAQLGNVEREIMRIICMYSPHSVPGIEDMYFMGQERIYGIDSNYAKSNWATRILLRIKYMRINDDPF